MTGRTPNNVDQALTPEPTPDQWDDHDEPTEPTVASTLLVGRRPDEHFAPAHEIGEALRDLRRKGRDIAEQPTEPPPEAPTLVQFCDGCGRYVCGFHWLLDAPSLFTPCGPVRLVEVDDLGEQYHARLKAAVEATKGRRKKSPTLNTNEWRDIPGYPGYQMHSETREVWRKARENILPNGTTRQYGSKQVIARNGSYSLTVDGQTSSRGVNALYLETFPEAGKPKDKRSKGQWDDTIRPRELPDCGVSEWVDAGGASIVTRPK